MNMAGKKARLSPGLDFFEVMSKVDAVKTTLIAGLACLIVAGSGSVQAAKPTLTFLKPVDLPEVGLRINLMPDARETPPPSPQVYSYRCMDRDMEWKEDRYAPADLWRHKQYAGQWVGRYGNSLMLATMTSRLPGEFKERHVTRETYEKQVAATGGAGVPVQDEADVTGWVAEFTDCPAVSGERVPRMPGRLDPVFCFRLDPQVPHRVAYAFRMNRSPVVTNAPSWGCAIFDVSPDISMEVACRAIEKEFLATVSLVAVVRPPVAPAKTAVNKAALPIGGSPEKEAARQQVTESIRNMKGWWVDASAHYIVLSNLKGNVKTLVEQLNKSMDALRATYARCLPEAPENEVSVIRMPATPEEYLAYVGSESAWTSGMWIPSRRELLIRALTDVGNQEKRRGLFRVAFHEGFHQYAFYALNHADPAMWFNEGYAQFFENAVILNGHVRIDENPRAVGVIKQMVNEGRADLARLLRLSREEFYDADDTVRAEHYALAWALVYYLKKGVSAEANSPYIGLLDKYVVAMRISGKNADEATAVMLDRVDLAKLTLDFERFWKSTTRQAAARRYDPFP